MGLTRAPLQLQAQSSIAQLWSAREFIMSRRPFLSENRQERAQSHWFGMARRILHQRRGPVNVMLPLSWEGLPVTLPATKEHPQGAPVPPPQPEICHHPVNFLIRGGNQHGKWKKCAMCGKKLEYKKWGPEHPPSGKTSKKNQTLQTYVSTGPPVEITAGSRRFRPSWSSRPSIWLRTRLRRCHKR